MDSTLVEADGARPVWRSKTIAAVIVMVASVDLAGCKPTEADPRSAVPLVRLATVKTASAGERAYTGNISARVQTNLGFRVSGKIIERLVDTGQTVRSGQPLMKLDPVDLKLAIVTQNNAVIAARATAVQARADEMRYRKLASDGWTSHQRYEQAKSALDNAEAALAGAEANAEVARNAGEYSVLLADADGVVMQTLGEPGQVISAGQAVVRLAHAGPREATVNLPETVRPAIGSQATATLYGDPGSRSPAQLRQLSDAADPVTRTYEARFVLGAAASKAPLGATVTIYVPLLQEKHLLEVPVGAIVDSGAASGVWLLDQRELVVAFRRVKIEAIGDETALIRDGIQAGEQVVALGSRLLHEGDSVRIAGDEAASR